MTATGKKIVLSDQQKQAVQLIFGDKLAQAIQEEIDTQAKRMAQAVKPKTIKLSLAGNYFGLNGTSGREAMITKYFRSVK